MANRIQGVHEKVLECAKAEFLEKGYKDASLRIIAHNANTTTGSIYTRFSHKEGLFEAVVGAIAEEFKEWFCNVHRNFHNISIKVQKKITFRHFDEGRSQIMNSIVDYVYDHFDIFKILLTGAEGTRFSSFLNDLVEIENESIIKFIKDTGNDALNSKRVSPELSHILVSAYFSGLFEIVLHDMTKDATIIYAKQLMRFFSQGWDDIFTPSN